MELFKDFPSSSRVWLFLADRMLTADESASINNASKQFAEQWTAHNKALRADSTVIDNCVLAFAVDENVHGASGCSIDKLHGFIRRTESEYHVKLFDRMRIAFRQHGELKNTTVNEFLQRYKAAETPRDITVLNMLVDNTSDLRERFEIPLAESWVATRLTS